MAYQFGVGAVFATQTFDASGVATALAQPIQLGTLQDVSLDISFDTKELHGAKSFALAIGRGKGKIAGKAKLANIDGDLMSKIFFGRTPETVARGMSPNELHTADVSVVVVPPSTGVFAKDMGVVIASSGVAMVRVASAPAAGEYSVDAAGEYVFSAADAAADVAVRISYEFTKSTGGKVLRISNELMGTAPFFSFTLRSAYQGREILLTLNKVISNKLAVPFKNDDFSMADIEFSAMEDEAGEVGLISFR